MVENEIMNEIFDFYIKSKDFNGIPFLRLIEKYSISETEMKEIIEKLIKSNKINLVFSQTNPHIKLFPDLSQSKQLEVLKTEDVSAMCLYPSSKTLEGKISPFEFSDSPFSRQLLLGDPQLKPIFFDLPVLDPYFK